MFIWKSGFISADLFHHEYSITLKTNMNVKGHPKDRNWFINQSLVLEEVLVLRGIL